MNNPYLTKICASCGQQKSLTAFSQLAGPQGKMIYGNICAACRKAALEKLGKSKDSDDGTASTTEHTIDAKTKVQGEANKRELRKHIDELNQEEKEKIEEIKLNFIEKRQQIATKEKDHRDLLQKRSVFSHQSTGKTAEAKVVGGVEQAAKEGRIDLTNGFRDTEVAGKSKYNSAIFQQFKQWLGDAAPIVGNAKKMLQNNDTKQGEKAKPESSTEIAQKTWGPSSKR